MFENARAIGKVRNLMRHLQHICEAVQNPHLHHHPYHSALSHQFFTNLDQFPVYMAFVLQGLLFVVQRIAHSVCSQKSSACFLFLLYLTEGFLVRIRAGAQFYPFYWIAYSFLSNPFLNLIEVTHNCN